MADILQKIHEYSLEDIMGDSFSRYSKYIIQDRAIPDVRDGLKPVQRRILYSMYKNKLTVDAKEKKCAHVIGDVMAKYHPHGDSSIYDALVRMSQSWKSSHPLVSIRGNNGSVDGDGAAAYRYTEAKLSKISNELLKDIDKNTVIFTPTYDDTGVEPTVLPCKFPNLLVSGTTGISAGYATNIPPHNLGEIIDATIKRIDSPNCRLETILDIVKGPDFPTGGVAIGIDGIHSAYSNGKGKIIIRGKVEVVKKKGLHQIIIHEIPYDINKALLCRKIDEIRIDKKIDGITEIRDESDKETGYRIAIDLKNEANSELILNYLYKNTDLQISYNYNMVTIVNKRPKLLGILPILDAYIKHEKEVIQKRTEFDLAVAETRYHIVEGLIKAVSILDEVIAVIRKSKNKGDAEANLVNEFQFTPKQAEAIVILRLYNLTNTDIEQLREEQRNLMVIINGLKNILQDELVLLGVIKDDLRRIKKEYAVERKTTIEDAVEEIKIDITAMIPKEDVVVIVTKDGYIKRVSMRSYAASKQEDTGLKHGDLVSGMYEMNTLHTILLFTNLGNYLYLPIHEIPEAKWKDLGKHISNIIPIKEEERIIHSIPVSNFDQSLPITFFTKLGMIKQTTLLEFKVGRYSKPIVCMKLKEYDEVIGVSNKQASEVLLATKNGYGLRYDLTEVPVVGIRAAGVKSMNLKEDEIISGMLIGPKEEYVSIFMDKGTGKRIKISDIEKTTRAKRGVQIRKEVKSNPSKIVACFVTNPRHNVILTFAGSQKQIKLTELPIMDRYSIGSALSKRPIVSVDLLVSLEKEIDPEEKEVIELHSTLEQIDERMMTIDDFLDDFKVE